MTIEDPSSTESAPEAAAAAAAAPEAIGVGPPVGIFEGTSDIGSAQPGWTVYNSASGIYRVTGGGAGIGGEADSFHFAWRRHRGDGQIAAEIMFPPGRRSPRQQAVLVFRQSLDAGAAYAGIMIHGDGHISFQYRQSRGRSTFTVVPCVPQATTLSLRREGGRLTAFASAGAAPRREAAMIVLPLHDPLLAGIGVSAHSTDELATIHFARVRVTGSPFD